jgi:hypothetical protein
MYPTATYGGKLAFVADEPSVLFVVATVIPVVAVPVVLK